MISAVQSIQLRNDFRLSIIGIGVFLAFGSTMAALAGIMLNLAGNGARMRLPMQSYRSWTVILVHSSGW